MNKLKGFSALISVAAVALLSTMGYAQTTGGGQGGSSGGGVSSVSGTANQVDVATGTTTPVISLDPAINLPGSLTAGNGASITVSGTGTNNATALNGTALSGLATGILKITTGTGVPSIAVAADLPNIPFSQLISATGAIATIANGNNPWTLNCAQTTNTQSCASFGETSAATGGAANNEVAISTAANSTATVLNLTQGAISTVFPTAGINLSQGANTGATNVPGGLFAGTWNNASIVGPFFKVAVTNTSSTAGSPIFQVFGGAGGATSEFNVNTAGVGITPVAFQSALFEGATLAAGTTFCGGPCTAALTSPAGAALYQGGDNSSANAAAMGGPSVFRAGMLTNATPNAAQLPGTVQLEAGAIKGSAVAAVGDILTGAATQYNMTDCPITGCLVTGIATSTANPIGYVTNGQALVKLDGALAAIGNGVCTGTTTAGQGHDNGAVGNPCPQGMTYIGQIIADVGTIITSTGSTTGSTAMSTTLPMVALAIGGIPNGVSVPQTNSSPVTVSNPTGATDTIMMAIPLPAGYLNVVGTPFRIVAAGVLTTTTASTPQVTITPKICSIAGCATGTVTPLAVIQSSALNTTAVVNATWKEDLDLLVVANGASCNFIVKGTLAIDLGAAVASTPDTIFVDSNTAASSPNQTCTAALFLDFFVQQSTTGASNSYKQLLGMIR